MFLKSKKFRICALIAAVLIIALPLSIGAAASTAKPPAAPTMVVRDEPLPPPQVAPVTPLLHPLLLQAAANQVALVAPLVPEKPAEPAPKPPVVEQKPAAAEKPPATEEKAPATEEKAPTTEEKAPTTEEQAPVEEEAPIIDEKPVEAVRPANLNSFQRNGMIRVKDLQTVADDYHSASDYTKTVPDDFLNEINGMGEISVSQFKAYAKEFQLPGQYIQRFIDDAFVYKVGNDYTYVPVDNSLPKSNYNWDNLVHYHNEKDYLVNGNSRVSKGIDVSYAQGDINWNKVAADGVEFAFIRIGVRYGQKATIDLDKKFHQNMEGAQAAGIKVGVYFYSQAINSAEAREEANFVLDNLSGYTLQMPVVFDIEGGGAGYRAQSNSIQTNTNVCKAFLDTVKDAGYPVMLYSYAKYATEHFDLTQLQEYDFWMAQYYRVPFYPYRFKMWQYTGSGSVSGIKGPVDMNLMFLDY